MVQVVIESSTADVLSREQNVVIYILTLVFAAATVLFIGHSIVMVLTSSQEQLEKKRKKRLNIQFKQFDSFVSDFSNKAYELAQVENVETKPTFTEYNFSSEAKNTLYESEAKALEIVAPPSFEAVEL